MEAETAQVNRLIYGLGKHPYLGYIIEAHVATLTPAGTYSLSTRRVFSHTVKEYLPALPPHEARLLALLDEADQDNIIKSWYSKQVRSSEFFVSVFNQASFDALHRPRLDKLMANALELIHKHNLPLYTLQADGSAGGAPLQFGIHAVQIHFHFKRAAGETRYFPILRYGGQRLEFMFQHAELVLNQPAVLLLHATLYFIAGGVEGKKLAPFLNKRFMAVPESAEEVWFNKFVAPLIEKHRVYAQGFEIVTQTVAPTPVLLVNRPGNGNDTVQLFFDYGSHSFSAASRQEVMVICQPAGESYIFTKVVRSQENEARYLRFLEQEAGADIEGLFGYIQPAPEEGIAFPVMLWLARYATKLTGAGFVIRQTDGHPPVILSSPELSVTAKEMGGWFDIAGTVRFGNFEIPFAQLRKNLLSGNPFFILPDGTEAVIPYEWFAAWTPVFEHAADGPSLRMKKIYTGLLQQAAPYGLAGITLQLSSGVLNSFDSRKSQTPMPRHFNATLRSYQEQGYQWLHYLRNAGFGGCLADDMGLGKTLQTLAMLQYIKEQQPENGRGVVSLLVMPASLTWNWVSEIKKFASQLRVYLHTGAARSQSVLYLQRFDVVITTYGIVRSDIELLKQPRFEYLILDESQYIKNAESKSAKAILKLQGRHRLALSGTPVENSLTDLWAQFAFINPELLGSAAWFKANFVVPVERQGNEAVAARLRAMVKPFILRRTKEQVATELPPKTQQVVYCSMEPPQAAEYEKVRMAYRTSLLEAFESGTFKAGQLHFLQGLTRLRQIANHPGMVHDDYTAGSGKFEAVLQVLENVLTGNHKVLVFSQFTGHLKLFAQHLHGRKMPYAYLDGSTTNRQQVIENFQENPNVKVFLISLKAGGVGLNLTQADYVFILDPWWNPAAEQQAIDRSHRMGQDKPVFVYKFITINSVEEKIQVLQQKKKNLADALVTTDAGFYKQLSESDIAAIFE